MGKIDNVKELLQAINHFESQKTTTIADFLDEVALMQAQIQAESNEKDPVLLMTLHAAKGLEFDTVILTGLEEGLLPSTRSLASEEAIEEERRLFYVGITRAQERLLLTYCRYRYHFGTMTDQRPSRFVQEIPSGTVPASDASYWNALQMNQFFSSWLSNEGSLQYAAEAATPSLRQTATADRQGERLFEGLRINGKKPFVVSDAEGVVSNHHQERATKISSAHPEEHFSATRKMYKKNQPVSHQKFGLGIIQDIELRADGITYLQVKFKTGSKKLDATFVKTT
jgi:ATP-dependent exoDNAse (exonuclease V) beta subunit